VGQHRITTIDLTTEAADEKRPSKKVVEAVEAETAEAAKKPRRKKVRSKRYQHLRGMVDRTKTYPLAEAVALVKKTTYAKFGGSIRADVVLTDNKLQTEIAFTHPTGKKIKVAIASETLLDEVEKGKLDFDILVASPEMMPKIAKLAKILGPRGLMPNPKNGTVTAKPEEKKKELEGGKLMVRTEKKAPLMHTVVGSVAMKEGELVDNVTALIKAVNARKISKLVLSATMSPGVKVDVSEFIAIKN